MKQLTEQEKQEREAAREAQEILQFAYLIADSNDSYMSDADEAISLWKFDGVFEAEPSQLGLAKFREMFEQEWDWETGQAK